MRPANPLVVKNERRLPQQNRPFAHIRLLPGQQQTADPTFRRPQTARRSYWHRGGQTAYAALRLAQ